MKDRKPAKTAKKVKFEGFECLRCGHQWRPRKDGRPMTCAGCRSPYWDTPRQADVMPRKKRKKGAK